MKYLCFALFCSLFGYSQKIKFQVKDSLTKNNIEFVSVNLLNGYGVFSDIDGIVNLDLTGIHKMELSHISYNKKTINVSEIDSVIYLKQSINILKEIVVSKKLKKKYFKKEIEKNKNYSYVDFGTYGYQIASLIQLDTLNYYLDEVSIPIEIDKLWMEINNQNFIPNSIVKISFHKNINNYPSEYSIIDSENIFINKNVLSKKMIEYKLKNSILIPNEGIFFMITFLGKADANGDLIMEMPFYKQTFLGEEIIFAKYHPIKIPIALNSKNVLSYCRNFFYKDLSFSKLFPTITVPRNYVGEEKKEYLQKKLNTAYNYCVNIGFKYFKYE